MFLPALPPKTICLALPYLSIKDVLKNLQRVLQNSPLWNVKNKRKLSFSRSNMSLINKLQPCILMLRSLGRLCKVFLYIHWQINILVWWSNSTSLFNSSIALVIDGRTRVIQNTPPWLHMTMTHVKGRVEENRDTTIINKYIIAGTIPTIHASNWLIYNLLSQRFQQFELGHILSCTLGHPWKRKWLNKINTKASTSTAIYILNCRGPNAAKI